MIVHWNKRQYLAPDQRTIISPPIATLGLLMPELEIATSMVLALIECLLVLKSVKRSGVHPNF